MRHDCVHKVSIIVPAYNAEPYIRNCLSSLLCQTYKKIEIILIDDGSTDATGHICDTYQQVHGSLIKVVHCRHCGVSYARLSGLQKAAGEYVVFVDADDWIERDYIQSMLSCMEEADIVAAGISREVLNEKESAVSEYNGISPGRFKMDFQREELYGKMLYCKAPYQFGVLPYMCNKMFRRDRIQPFLERTDKRIFDGEDAAVVYPYLLESREIVLTDECKYHYVNHRDSASLKDSQKAYFNAACLYQELYVCFTGSEYRAILLTQLDHYMRRLIWKKNPAEYLRVNSFLFPYEKVRQGSKIVLYGMGKVGEAFYQQIRQTGYCVIAAWADRNPGLAFDISGAVPGIFPDEIKKYSFDYVVIAIENKGVSYKITEKLCSMGIAREKIIISDF